MSRLNEILGQMQSVRSELLALADVEEPTTEQSERFAALEAEFDALEAERAPLAERAEKIDRIRSVALDPSPSNVSERADRPSAPEFMKRSDPFENLDAIRAGFIDERDLRARALTALESVRADGVSDDAREAATRTVQSVRGAARHVLLTGSDEYRSAFEKWLRNPESFQIELSQEEGHAFRAALSLATGAGGYLLPTLLDNSIISTRTGTTNPIRQIARVEQITQNVWNGVASAGVTAYLVGEGAAMTAGEPSFTSPSIQAYKAAAWLAGSYEIFEDSNLAEQLPAMIQAEKDDKEAAWFTTGSGSSAPLGVVTGVAAVTTSRVAPTTAGVFTTASVADIYKVINAVGTKWRSRSKWLANFVTYSTIRGMSASAAGSSFWANLGAALPEELVGLPIYEASEMTSTATTGSNLLLAGDFANFCVVDRLGMQLEYVPNIINSVSVPTGQRGYIAHWRVGSGMLNANAFRLLQL